MYVYTRSVLHVRRASRPTIHVFVYTYDRTGTCREQLMVERGTSVPHVPRLNPEDESSVLMSVLRRVEENTQGSIPVETTLKRRISVEMWHARLFDK